MVFNNLKHPITFKVSWIKCQCFEVGKAFASNPVIGIRNQCYATRLIGWSMPSDGWVKVNTDGCSKGNLLLGGAVGLIRNSQGDWICGFACNIGSCSPIEAEL